MRYCLLIPILLLLAACHRTAPQAPSSGQEPDTLFQKMLDMNQRLALEADEQLAHYVAQHEGFVRDSTGIWLMMMVRNPEADTFALQTPVQVDYSIWGLSDSTCLEQVHKTATLGKKQLPAAVETAVRQMRNGESAVILAPWYQMYGREGHGRVEPYQQVRVELSVKS